MAWLGTISNLDQLLQLALCFGSFAAMAPTILMTTMCSHDGCTKRVFTNLVCSLHDGTKVEVKPKKKPFIDMSTRTVSVSKDGTKRRFYKLCTDEGCENIAKKLGKCYRHGAPRTTCSVDGCTSNSKISGFCQRHHTLKSVSFPLKSRGEDAIGDGEVWRHAVPHNKPAPIPNISVVTTMDLNLIEEEKLGNFIYDSSRTAKLLRANEEKLLSFAHQIEQAANTAKMKKMEEEQIYCPARGVFTLATRFSTAGLVVDDKKKRKWSIVDVSGEENNTPTKLKGGQEKYHRR